MTISIRRVGAAHEVEAIHRQRFAIYVDELNYPQRYADPATRCVAEPLDDTGVLFGAFDGERLVGSVRVNYGGDAADVGGDGGLREYASMYGLTRFGRWFPAGISVVTKLMIEPSHRAGTLLARFAVALYVYTRDHRPQTQFCVIDCVPALCPFFLRLGYRPIGPRLRHPAAGWVVPMAFPVYDLQHFRSVHSPLAAVCPRHEESAAAWFRETLVDALPQPQESMS